MNNYRYNKKNRCATQRSEQMRCAAAHTGEAIYQIPCGKNRPGCPGAAFEKKGRRKKRYGVERSLAVPGVSSVVKRDVRVKLDGFQKLFERELHASQFLDQLLFLSHHSVLFNLRHSEDSFRPLTMLIILKKMDLSSRFAQII